MPWPNPYSPLSPYFSLQLNPTALPSVQKQREATAISESVAPPLLSEKKAAGKPFEYATALCNSTAEADPSLSQMTATLFPRDMTKRRRNHLVQYSIMAATEKHLLW